MVGPKDRNQKSFVYCISVISWGSYCPPGGGLQGNCYHSALLISSLTCIQLLSLDVFFKVFPAPSPAWLQNEEDNHGGPQGPRAFCTKPRSAKVGCETHISHPFSQTTCEMGGRPDLVNFYPIHALLVTVS